MMDCVFRMPDGTCTMAGPNKDEECSVDIGVSCAMAEDLEGDE